MTLQKVVILGMRRYASIARGYDTAWRAFDGQWYGRHLIHTDSDGNRNIFNVEHDNDELWLNWNNGNPDNVWNPDNRFVFVLLRNSHHSSPR